MYRSKYGFKAGKDRHETLETIEATIQRNVEKLKPEIPLLHVPDAVRNRHIYAIGKTRFGKTTLLHSIIEQDIANGHGVCVLDPKPCGEGPNLVESILPRIPASREQDVIHFTADDPVPLDVMSWDTERERQWVGGDLMRTFMQFLAQKEGDRWPTILRFIINALLAANSKSYLDIYNFCIDEHGARKQILSRIDRDKHSELLKYWEMFPSVYKGDALAPIVSRMGNFVLMPPLKKMLGPYDSPLNIEDVIRKRKILLVDLSTAGEEVGQFIGILLVSRIQQAVFRGLGVPFHLFADEFQNFQTSAFDKILSEAGGLGLRLTLANQYLTQMDLKIRKSVMGNVSTFFVFNIGPDDTSEFQSIMPEASYIEGKPNYLKHDILARQPRFQALFAIADQQPIFKKIPRPPALPTEDQLKRAQRIKSRTLSDYSCKREPKLHNSSSEEPKTPPAATTPQDDAGRSSASRQPFRPTQQERRAPSQKTGANEERHQDDKPEPEAT